MKARLFLFLFTAACIFISRSASQDTIGYYSIPEPNILAFEGGGIRVILKDDAGISLIRFHANVNEEMKQLYPGTINLESSLKTNGNWVLENKSVNLQVGDVIYYWLFVEKNRLGYVKQPVRFKIRDLVSYYQEGNNEDPTPHHPFPITSTTPRTTTSEATPAPSPHTPSSSLSSLQSQVDDLTKKIDLLTSISALQGKVDILSKKLDGFCGSGSVQPDVKNISKTVELIIQTLENLPGTKRLTLSGVIPPDQASNNPDHVVRLVIWEKLDLRVNVVTAVRKNDGTIVFELKTLQEKFDVLRAAEEKLKDTRIIIS